MRHVGAILALTLLFPSLPLIAQTRVIAFGDSITLGLGDTGVDCADPITAAGYPPRLGSLLGQQGTDTEIIISGVCGETTSEGVSRIDEVLAEQQGGVILLMEGTNDISERVSTETMRLNLEEMARKASEAGIEPVFSSVIPRGPNTTSDSDNQRAAFFAFILGESAELLDREFADPFNALIDVPDLFTRFYIADGYHPNPQGYNLVADAFVGATLRAVQRDRTSPCVVDDTTLCLNQNRFRLQVEWTDFAGNHGVGHAVPLSGDTGYFWFFNSANVELTIKALDGRCFNDHFWIFYGALSNVEYTITVTDTETGKQRFYTNPLETFASVGDTKAFAVPRENCGN